MELLRKNEGAWFLGVGKMLSLTTHSGLVSNNPAE